MEMTCAIPLLIVGCMVNVVDGQVVCCVVVDGQVVGDDGVTVPTRRLGTRVRRAVGGV